MQCRGEYPGCEIQSINYNWIIIIRSLEHERERARWQEGDIFCVSREKDSLTFIFVMAQENETNLRKRKQRYS